MFQPIRLPCVTGHHLLHLCSSEPSPCDYASCMSRHQSGNVDILPAESNLYKTTNKDIESLYGRCLCCLSNTCAIGIYRQCVFLLSRVHHMMDVLLHWHCSEKCYYSLPAFSEDTVSCSPLCGVSHPTVLNRLYYLADMFNAFSTVESSNDINKDTLLHAHKWEVKSNDASTSSWLPAF